MTDSTLKPTHLLKPAEVLRRTTLSRSNLYLLMERGEFPKPVKISERINVWPDHEVEAWIQGRMAQREQV